MLVQLGEYNIEVLIEKKNNKNVYFRFKEDGNEEEDNIFTSPYIGDMENAKTYNSFEHNLNNFKQIYKIQPEIIAYDLHPDYWCNDLVNSFKGRRVTVQHHHGHIASCIAENNINENVIGIAYDGTGYGDDGNIWGGEFFLCNLKEYKRVGHLNYFSLAGGESAIKEPWRIALSQLYKAYGEEIHDYLPEKFKQIVLMDDEELKKVMDSGVKGIGTEATRANILKDLQSSGYISLSKNSKIPNLTNFFQSSGRLNSIK